MRNRENGKRGTDDRRRRNGERGSQKRKEEKRRQVVKIKPRTRVGTHGWKELQRNKKADELRTEERN